jgi:hypothetical protein
MSLPVPAPNQGVQPTADRCDVKVASMEWPYGLGDPVHLSSSAPCVPGNGEVRSVQKSTGAWEPYPDVGREEER